MSDWLMTRAELERTLIAAELRCGRCGYNLRGLSPLSVCPECGHDIWSTVLRTVDPAASRLPKLTNPRAVGWAILWIMLCSSLAALLMAFASTRDALDLAWSGVFAAPAESLALSATSAAAVAILGVFILTPPKGKERRGSVMARLWLLGVGLLVWAAANYWWSLIVAQPLLPLDKMLARMLMTVGWILTLLGLDGIMREIGNRSRVYRTARGSRQGARAMIAAAGAVALGTLVQGLSRMDVLSQRAEGYGTVLVWTSGLMLCIGLAYMFINSLWIFLALRSPPPPLSALLLKVEDKGGVHREG